MTHCILCGEEATIRIRVEDFDTLTCDQCDGEFTVSDVEERIAEMTGTVRACRAAQVVLGAYPVAVEV